MTNTINNKYEKISFAGNYKGYHQVHTAKIDEEISLIEPKTPCGEFFRRYWHPVSLTSDIGQQPLPVKILGEDLVLFRTKNGKIGLVHRQCPHRNASLVFGKCEKRGIRCCYHGWLFAPDGQIIETPGEAGDSTAAKNIRERLRLGAYPVIEYNGLVFAYMGPPEEIPDFPF